MPASPAPSAISIAAIPAMRSASAAGQPIRPAAASGTARHSASVPISPRNAIATQKPGPGWAGSANHSPIPADNSTGAQGSRPARIAALPAARRRGASRAIAPRRTCGDSRLPRRHRRSRPSHPPARPASRGGASAASMRPDTGTSAVEGLGGPLGAKFLVLSLPNLYQPFDAGTATLSKRLTRLLDRCPSCNPAPELARFPTKS